MKEANITTSNDIPLTTEDLKKAIKIADVNWEEAAYANDGAKSKNPIDICIFDFFGDGWDLVEDSFSDVYANCDEDKHLALAHIIEGRASIWHDWVNQAKETEELCFRVDGRPFSLDYAKLFIACNNDECEEYNLNTGVNTILRKSFSSRHYSGRNKARKLVRYHSSFIWGNVEYSVTQYYKEEHVRNDDIKDLPDFITIKVKKAED